MNGKDIVRVIDAELSKRGMTQLEFCSAIGVGSSAYSAWRKGSMPKPERIKQIEEYLGISFSDYETASSIDQDTAELLESLRSRPDLGVLLKSAKDVQPSSVYDLVSKLEKMKEDAMQL